MQLTPEFINEIISGQHQLPTVQSYHGYMEVDVVVTKAKKDTRFKPFNPLALISTLDNGMYVNDEQLFFKHDSDWMSIKTAHSSSHCVIVSSGNPLSIINRYFKDVKQVSANPHGLYKARMMKSYFHLFNEPLNTNKSSNRSTVRSISKETFDHLAGLFKKSEDFQLVDDINKYQRWLEETDSDAKTTVTIQVNDVYSFHLHLAKYKGFNIIMGYKEGPDGKATPVIETTYISDEDTIQFEHEYSKITARPLPESIKELIAFSFLSTDLVPLDY